MLITDGGFSCTSVSSPTRPGYSDGLCLDWEYPDTVNALIKGASTDPDKPINTFVVGVPGSNSKGEVQGSYATAPYHMRLALSTYAVNGSPETIDPACDKDLPFTKNGGGDPIKPRHSRSLERRGLQPRRAGPRHRLHPRPGRGCTTTISGAPPRRVLDPGLVNVGVTVAGQSKTVLKRSNPADTTRPTAAGTTTRRRGSSSSARNAWT